MNVRLTLAIDPGSAGGIAIGTDDGSGWTSTMAYPMPETVQDMVDLIKTAVEGSSEAEAFVEAQVGVVGPRTKVSAAAMFTFGEGYGAILGALAALGVRTTLVRPRKWQDALSLGKSERVAIPENAAGEELTNLRAINAAAKAEWKRKLKVKAQQLFPQLRVTLKTADCLLLLEYSRMITRPKEKSAWA